jgi:hypothetical protein
MDVEESQRMSRPTGPRDLLAQVLNHRGDLAWLCLFLLCAGVLQLSIPYPYDADTGYHFAAGSLIGEHGLLTSFPWLTFSWMSDHYADKELLFHLLFVPLSGRDFTTASRVVGTLCGAGILASIYVVLRSERIRMAGIWALLPLALSSSFTYRFAQVRPHLLSISLAILLLWAIARSKLVLAVIVSIIYPWAYVAFWQIPLLLLLAAEAGRFLHQKRVAWKPALAVLVGIAAGVLVHPNAGNLLQLNWIVQSNILVQNAWGATAGFELGQEFDPPTLTLWLTRLLPATLLVLFALVIGWRRRERDNLPLAFALAAIGFGVLTARTYRFVEYFVPMAAIAGAFAFDVLSWRVPAAILSAAGVMYTAAFGLADYLALTRRGVDISPSLAGRLRSNIPPDAQVFTPDWQMTGTYMMALPERKFIVALDPTLFYVKNPELYALWYRISRDAPPNLGMVIRHFFKARYVLFFERPEFASLLSRLETDPSVRLLLRTRIMYLFDLGDPLLGP